MASGTVGQATALTILQSPHRQHGASNTRYQILRRDSFSLISHENELPASPYSFDRDNAPSTRNHSSISTRSDVEAISSQEAKQMQVVLMSDTDPQPFENATDAIPEDLLAADLIDLLRCGTPPMIVQIETPDANKLEVESLREALTPNLDPKSAKAPSVNVSGVEGGKENFKQPNPYPLRPPPGSSRSTSHRSSTSDTSIEPAYPTQIEVPRPYSKEWGKIKKLRAEVRQLRSKSQRMRQALREKQKAIAIADDKYFQRVRKRRYLSSDPNELSCQDEVFEELYKESQRLRDECGPLEDDCVLLDDDLSYHEFELEKLEEKLYGQPLDPPALSAPSKIDPPKIIHESTTSSTYEGSEIDLEYHPLVYQYLSKLGDINNLNERLDWHEDEKANLEDDKETKLIAGIPLAEEARIWLDNYPNIENNLLEQIEKAEDEAEVLKKKCLAKGLIDKNGEPTDFETRERLTFIHDKPLKPGNLRSEFVNFPTLLPQPTGKQEQFKDPMLDPEEDAVDPKDRINGWLLHQLRMSALEVNRLAITYKSIYGYIPQSQMWEVKVLEWWFKDGAKKGDGKSGRTIKSLSSGEVTENPAETVEKA